MSTEQNSEQQPLTERQSTSASNEKLGTGESSSSADNIEISKAITNAMNKYNAAIINFKEFDNQLKAVRGNIYPEIIKLEDLHDFFRFDPKQKTTLRNYIPAMDSFPVLKDNERRILVSYYKLYSSQTSAELNFLRLLNKQNDELLTMIEQQ